MTFKNNNNNTCPICLDTIKNECFTGCGHSFCLDCILSWSKNHTCPCCRGDLKLETTENIEEIKAELARLKESKVIKFFGYMEKFFDGISSLF